MLSLVEVACMCFCIVLVLGRKIASCGITLSTKLVTWLPKHLDIQLICGDVILLVTILKHD